jgi:hypothetical protein
MQPHQQRVVDEKAELDSKLDKLKAFTQTPIYAGLDQFERERLSRQQGIMYDYSGVLGERIHAFNPDPPAPVPGS